MKNKKTPVKKTRVTKAKAEVKEITTPVFTVTPAPEEEPQKNVFSIFIEKVVKSLKKKK